MPALPNTPRPSKTENLESLYRTSNTATQPMTAIRSHIKERGGLMAWDLSKVAGTDRGLVDYMSNKYQTNFGRFGGGPFTDAGLDFAKRSLGHDNSNYH
jgi:hypothetical protein